MGVTGLLILLQMLLIDVWPVTSVPFCDQTFLDHYIRSIIKEDKEMTSRQEAEIRHGFTLLLNSVPEVTTFISQCKLNVPLQRFSSNIRTMGNILQQVNKKIDPHPLEDARTLTVTTLQQFYTVYKNFLVGKYKTLVRSLCTGLGYR
ncbi:uncharacterized protein [Eleutherodactylus coqui]|uniref:uncharacterized protein isoform X2 n=1 Tax=Eleutherodactylus coqui TaxID=57060 RepID=UPI003461CE95